MLSSKAFQSISKAFQKAFKAAHKFNKWIVLGDGEYERERGGGDRAECLSSNFSE